MDFFLAYIMFVSGNEYFVTGCDIYMFAANLKVAY